MRKIIFIVYAVTTYVKYYNSVYSVHCGKENLLNLQKEKLLAMTPVINYSFYGKKIYIKHSVYKT